MPPADDAPDDGTAVAARVAAAFEAAVPRMRGLPIVNPRLAVAAVDFQPWREHWLGVLVTPWCLNLMLLPRAVTGWVPLAVGAKRHFSFPAGDFEFVGAADPALGPYAMCSLLSPVHELADQPTAVHMARAARAALLDPANAPAAAATASTPPGIDPAQPAADHAKPAADHAPPARVASSTRRDLLRGRLRGRRGPAEDGRP